MRQILHELIALRRDLTTARAVRWVRSVYSARPGPTKRKPEPGYGAEQTPKQRTTAGERTAVPLHFGPPSRWLFGWYHPAAGERPRGAGIVLCNTLGNESLRAYGTLRHLAEDLAEEGFAVLRFDFHGTGDSSGSEADPDRLATWLEDIDLAIEQLKVLSGSRRIGLSGLRLGGTLAFSAAARRGDVESVVLWDPYYSGNDFVTETTRMHKALTMLELSSFSLKRPREGTPEGTEALGFYLSNSTVLDLSKLDLLSVEGHLPRRVVISGSAAARTRSWDALMSRLQAQGVDSRYEVLAPQRSRNLRLVSTADHLQMARDITRWISPHFETPEQTGSPSTSAAPRTVDRLTTSASYPDAGKADETGEEALFFGARDSLFGIATRPESRRAGRRECAIIIVNAGPGTRIGPHRQYVQMARGWAKLGFLVFRVDLSGSGDSVVEGTDESDPYPPRAIADIQAAMMLLEHRFSVSRFIVAGICSGADIAFRAAVEEPRVVGALIVNPRTFGLYNIPDLDQLVREQNLAATVSAKRNWRMLLRGEAGLKGSVLRISQVSRTAAAGLTRKLQSLFARGSSPTRAVNVPRYLRQMLERGVDTLLVVGERDVGIMYVESAYREQMRAIERLKGFRRVDFRGADHLFTSLYGQELLLETLTEHLVHSYPGTTSPEGGN